MLVCEGLLGDAVLGWIPVISLGHAQSNGGQELQLDLGLQASTVEHIRMSCCTLGGLDIGRVHAFLNEEAGLDVSAQNLLEGFVDERFAEGVLSLAAE